MFIYIGAFGSVLGVGPPLDDIRLEGVYIEPTGLAIGLGLELMCW